MEFTWLRLFVVVVFSAAIVESFAKVILRLKKKREENWGVVYVSDSEMGRFSDRPEKFSTEEEARQLGLRLHPPTFIRRPDGTEYQLTFMPFSHITRDKLLMVVDAEPAAFESMLTGMENHVRDCEPCREAYFRDVRTARLTRSAGTVLLNLSAENDRCNKQSLAAAKQSRVH